MDILQATLKDIKLLRPDLYQAIVEEALKPEKGLDDSDFVLIGDVIRWIPTGEEGEVCGFESFNKGRGKIIIEQYDGTKITLDNNPSKYEKLVGKDRDRVLRERKKFIKDTKREERNEKLAISSPQVKQEPQRRSRRILSKIESKISAVGRPLFKKKTTPQPIYDSNTTKREAFIGDIILYDSKKCVFIDKKTQSNSMRLVIEYENGIQDNVPNNWDRYEIVERPNVGKPRVRNKQIDEEIFRHIYKKK